MSASLVGSEMCIRDSPWACSRRRRPPPCVAARCALEVRLEVPAASACPVSYTHLTLPTICSV
eukprot:3258474-Alexandrium_andersonii.AAC.1